MMNNRNEIGLLKVREERENIVIIIVKKKREKENMINKNQ